MAEPRGVYEHLRGSWPVLLSIGCGLIWFGRNVQTGEQVDERIRVLIRPLQIRDEWFGKELLEQKELHPQLVEEIRHFEERLQRLELK